jgi:hypothetical protein
MFKNKLTFSLIILIILSSCSSNPFKSSKKDKPNEELTQKKKRAVFNVREKINSNESGIVFGGKKKDNFGKQNIMWVATLEVLNFLPINSLDYNGGLISTDWYSNENSNESIKINVSFLSPEIKTSSVEVKAFKKICTNSTSCKVIPTSKTFNSKIKDQIFEQVRSINLKNNKKG